MKAFLHLLNLICWAMVYPLFVLILSFVFDFTFVEGMRAVPAIYFFYCVIMLMAYCISESENVDTLRFF